MREFVERVFESLDLSWQDHVESDPRYLRPAEVDVLQGDASKAKADTGLEVRDDLRSSDRHHDRVRPFTC